jgi:glutathione S-transferase
MPPTLYCCPESGNCYKVRLLASLLNIPLDLINLDFFEKKEHKEPKFLEINPKGELPTLVDGDRIFTDSSAILVYLAGTYPDQDGSSKVPSSFWSADVAEQAHIVDWLAFVAGDIHTGLSKARAIFSFNWPPDASEDSLRESQRKGVRSLEVLETRLEKKEWLVGVRPTVADVAVYVYVGLAPMAGVSLEPYRAVNLWLERMRQLPGYIKPDGLDKPLQNLKR